LAGTAAEPWVGHVLVPLTALARAAGHTALGILARELLRSTQRALRWRLSPTAVALGS